MPQSVVLLSGGLDSAVVTALEVGSGVSVRALWVDYGQAAARRERAAARSIARLYGIHLDECVVRVPGGTCLGTSRGKFETAQGAFVRGRNLMLLTLAAMSVGSEGGKVCIGATAEDAFPDTRTDYYERVAALVDGGKLAAPVRIGAPLVSLTKRAVIELGFDLGIPLGSTWSCYRGGRRPCGQCLSCQHIQRALSDAHSSERGDVPSDLESGTPLTLDEAIERLRRERVDGSIDDKLAASWRDCVAAADDPVVVPCPQGSEEPIMEFVARAPQRSWQAVFVVEAPDATSRLVQSAVRQRYEWAEVRTVLGRRRREWRLGRPIVAAQAERRNAIKLPFVASSELSGAVSTAGYWVLDDGRLTEGFVPGRLLTELAESLVASGQVESC